MSHHHLQHNLKFNQTSTPHAHLNTTKSHLKNKIELLLLDFLVDCHALRFPSRSRANCLTRHDGTLVLSNKTTLRNSQHMKSLRKCSLMWCMLQEIHHLLQTGSTLVTQRDLFYKVIHRGFRNQQEVNEMILDVGAVLEAPRIEMGICASSKGFVGGNLQWRHKSMGGARSFLEKDVSWFDVSKHEYGVPISGSVVWTEYDVHSEARVILIVEKEGIFHRLMEDCFSSVLPSIIVTGCGFPDLSTRMLVHRLHSVLQIPVLCLVDYNPFGYQIFTTFAHGSARMGMETSHYSLPHTQWLGLRHEDTQNIHPSQKQPFTMLDEQKANELLCCLMAEEQQSVTAATNETNIRELFLMSQNKYKVELQVLYNSLGLTNFSYYIRELIKKRYPEISSNPSWEREQQFRNSF
mmetsp:Transcript_466/g.1770  ORF Transcript_466/g.1770 Transcript_466/m.1770 type:complete len:407 (-) Transcript_466:79-1299(-)